jgi:hypothetical protein
MHTYQIEKWGIIFGVEWIIDELRHKPEPTRWYEQVADEYARIE